MFADFISIATTTNNNRVYYVNRNQVGNFSTEAIRDVTTNALFKWRINITYINSSSNSFEYTTIEEFTRALNALYVGKE